MIVAKLVVKMAEVANWVVPKLLKMADLAELELFGLELLVFFWLLLYAHVLP